MSRLTLRLHNPVQAHQALDTAWKHIKGWLVAGGGRLVLEVRPEDQTREQQKKYHAMIGEITEQSKHLGSKWEIEDWKRLLIDKFARDTGKTHGKIIPNLDNNGVVEVGVLSRKFGKAVANEFIEWLHFWGAENGVTYSDDHEFIDQETGEISQ